MRCRTWQLCWAIPVGIEFVVSCASAPQAAPVPARETPIPVEAPLPALERDKGPLPPAVSPGFADEVRTLTERGVYASMLRALELIRSRGLGSSEFGRVMNGVNVTLIRRVYADAGPDSELPPVELPEAHGYARIIRDAERGAYTPAAAGSADYLEHILPFLALLGETRQERLLEALPDLEKARRLRPNSVLAPYFSGIVFERIGRFREAEAAYTRAYTLSRDCYPAVMGLVRLMDAAGKKQEALKILAELESRYPENTGVKRQLVHAYYGNEDWARAEPLVADLLRQDSRDGELILMRAHILVELGRYAQAQAPLDQYASINPNNRLYLFVRARLQAEGYRNRDSALNYLRSILRVSPGDEAALVYAARLLMDSPRSTEQSEGRELMGRLLRSPTPSHAVLSLGVRDALGREDWRVAQGFLNRLLDERRSRQDLLDATLVEGGLGNKSAALAYARELYDRDRLNDEGVAAYVSALIDSGRREEAWRLNESGLRAAPAGPAKSRYHYLQSRLRSGEEAALGDLRSSLFEDPRNLDALIAMFEIYRRRKDGSRALYYLKQARAIAPDNSRLRRYEREYAGNE